MLFLIFLELYDLPSLAGIEKYLSKWNLREENYVNFILTDDIQVCINLLTKVNTFLKKIFKKFLKIFGHD